MTFIAGAKIAWGFVKSSWKPVTIVLLVILSYWKITTWYDAFQEQQLAEQKLITKLTVERDRAMISAASFQAVAAEKAMNELRLELLFEKLLDQQKLILKESDRQKDIFENHNFEALTNAKPGLIENLANKATQERMDAFEDAINN